jgi:hypothetical protein
MTRALERRLRIGAGFGEAWYSSPKEHWLRWLSEYGTAGVYGRTPAGDLPCEAIYNRLQCPPMVFWLGDAVEVPKGRLTAAYWAATSAPRQYGRQTAAIRREIPWRGIETKIHQLSEGGATRCNGQSGPTIAPSAKLQRVATPTATGCNRSATDIATRCKFSSEPECN